jgi:hypothetical protein
LLKPELFFWEKERDGIIPIEIIKTRVMVFSCFMGLFLNSGVKCKKDFPEKYEILNV